MRWGGSLLIAALLATLPALRGQPYKPVDAEKQQIRAKMGELAKAIQGLRERRADDALLAEVEVYHKAAEWILRYEEEFYNKSYLANTLAALDKGLTRAKELEAGNASWPAQKGRFVRAYRSRVDGSVQPYGLVIPDSYDGATPVRLDLVLHGRGATLNEVSFIAAHDSRQPIPSGQDYIELEVFGRTNNAYRWAGETDVFEALESVRKRYNIDSRRIVLRGFSMGGAGGWHIGLHYPDRWAAVESGAGFTETRRYAKQTDLPPYQEAALHIYDAVDYALNAFNLPMVGYGSEDDPQLQASVNIREQLAREGLALSDLRALFLVGPRVGHRFPPDSKGESSQFIDAALPQRVPNRLRFLTYTARYNRCFWVTVEGLEKHYQRAEVDAERSDDGRQVTIKTTNVARLLVDQSETLTIDGQKVTGSRVFEKKEGRWAPGRPAASGKTHGLQGPIDDAFLDSFLCVRPTGRPIHPLANDYALSNLDRFAKEYAKWLRGDVRIKDDRAVTEDDIAHHNLILFGDPSSNRILARLAGRLPIHWTKQGIVAGGAKFPAAEHALVMIYPNPLNPSRYIVLNSGHTFHEKEFRGTNALLFPRLGDYAVLRLAKQPSGEITDSVVTAGLFDEHWGMAGR